MTLRDRFGGISVAESLARRVAGDPERPFLVLRNRRLTYREVDERATSLAAALSELGIEAGDRVALNLPNWPEFVIAMFAAAKLGAVIVPINPKHTRAELQYMLRHSESAVMVSAEVLGDVDYLERFESLLASLPELQYMVAVGEQDLWYDDRVYQFDDLLSSGEGRTPPPVEIDPERDTFAIVYTSGTTGKPKGVALSHRNVLAPAAGLADVLALGEEDVVFGVTSLFNVFGLGPGVLGTLVAGGTLVLDDECDPAGALEVMEREGVTCHHGVPTTFIREMQERGLADRDLSRLRTGVIAGAPIPDGLVERVAAELVPDIRVAYGLTEAGSAIAVTREDDPRGKRTATVGRPLDDVQVRVIDMDGTVLPVESIGEIALKGPGVMDGYYRQPGETAQSFTEDGFLLTGDLGMVDEEGYLHIVGRRKDVIIRGGLNVYPREVEDRLHAHPAVFEVVVVGMPDEVLGEVVCACVVPVEGAIVTGAEIKEFCREVLAEFKVPDLVRFLDRFPMTGSGKVRRVELVRMISAEESSRRP
jgi:fatty-acyl-CoA synthase